MEIFAEVLKYVLPAVTVLIGMYLVFKELRKKEEVVERYALRSQALKQVIPLRLQAYERAILFLERISPENMILRLDTRNKNSRMLLIEIQGEIRAEYEHNLAQQLYIEPASWVEVVRAKEQVLALVNASAGKVPPEAPAAELGKIIIGTLMNSEISPAHRSIAILKSDINKMFRL